MTLPTLDDKDRQRERLYQPHLLTNHEHHVRQHQ